VRLAQQAASAALLGSPSLVIRHPPTIVDVCLCSAGWHCSRSAIPSTGHDGEVPRISFFYGIAITMYFYDHEPPISMPSTPSITR
jgi:hypothetical protein